MIISLSGLLLTAVGGALSWLVVSVLRRSRGPLPRAAFAVAAFAPALLLFGCLELADLQGRIGELRLSLQSIELASGAPAVTVGGDGQADDFVAPGLAKGAVSLSPAGVKVRLFPTDQDRTDGAPPAIVSLGRGAERRFLGEQVLKSGDAVCLRRCDGASAQWYQFDAAAARFWPARMAEGRIARSSGAASGPPMPQRRALKLFPGLSWGPDQAVFPLRNHLPAADGAPESAPESTPGGGDCGQVWYCTAAGQPVRSFLFQLGGLRRDWRILLLDPGARLAHVAGGGAVSIVAPEAEAEAAITTATEVVVWEARFSDVEPLGVTGALGRLVERRSLEVGPSKDGGLAIGFDTDPVVVAGVCNQGRRAFARTVANQDPAPADAVALPELGGGLASSLSGPLGVSTLAPCHTLQRVGFELARPHTGSGFGASGRFRLDWFGGFTLLWVIAAAWAGLSFRLQQRLWPDGRIPLALTAVVQLLLGLRLLFGIAGAGADPSLDWRSLAASTALAYVAVPALALLWGPASLERRRAAFEISLFTAAVVAALSVWLGPAALLDRGDRLSLALCALVIAGSAVCVLRLPVKARMRDTVKAFTGQPWAPWALLAVLAAALAAAAAWLAIADGSILPVIVLAFALAALAVWRLQSRRFPSAVWNQPWAVVLLLAAAARVAIGFLGVKERAGVAVSALYTPAMIAGFALLLTAMLKAAREDRAQAARLAAICFAAAVALAVTAVAFAVSDSGYALVVTPVLFGAGAWWGLTQAAGKGGSWRLARLGWGAPAAALTALWLCLLILLPRLDAFEDFNAILRATGDDQAERVLDTLSRHLQVDNNLTRIYALARPYTLASTGTADAETQRAWSVQVNDYTAPVLGRGYLTAPHLTSLLEPVQLSDNASAIQLMSPFGRLSAATLLLLLGLLAAGCARASLPAAGASHRSAPEVAAILSLWLVFGTAAYMVLGNLQLVPFTGRNVYLLAPGSESDLLEALSLFAIAFWGLGRATPKSDPKLNRHPGNGEAVIRDRQDEAASPGRSRLSALRAPAGMTGGDGESADGARRIQAPPPADARGDRRGPADRPLRPGRGRAPDHGRGGTAGVRRLRGDRLRPAGGRPARQARLAAGGLQRPGPAAGGAVPARAPARGRRGRHAAAPVPPLLLSRPGHAARRRERLAVRPHRRAGRGRAARGPPAGAPLR